MNFKEALTTLPQYLLPHHPLSRLMGLLTHSTNKNWKNFYIKQIIRHFKVNMDEAIDPDINAYDCFNDFFTRALKPGVRPVADQKNAIVCPADGSVSQTGDIIHGKIFQAKGKSFTATELLGGDKKRARPFGNGKFATVYLSPKDYHRLHMPLAGTLKEMVHVPGRLFSVNGATTHSVPGLFARNERVAAIFDTEAGPMALVLVGAIFVASIETVWHGVITPPSSKSVYSWRYDNNPPKLDLAEEMGRFNMGSTIIMLFGHNQVNWLQDFVADKEVQLGQMVGEIIS